MRRAAGYSSDLQIPVPRLPGNDSRRPGEEARPKSSIFRYINGVPTVVEKVDYHNRPADDTSPHKEEQHTGTIHAISSQPFINTRPSTSGLRRLPPWLQYDRHTLKFHAYFKESVPENPAEPWRVRRCNVLFYLEDDSLQIIEPREDNSGLQQGTLLRRHRATYQDGSFVQRRHLSVGSTVRLYGREYYLTGCDEWTRGFMQEQGLNMPPDTATPEGPFDLQMKDRRAKLQESIVKPTSLPVFLPQQRPVSYQHYVDMDRKVLRFYAFWDNSASELGDKLPYVIHYFLTDDTIEVREVHLRNDGRDPFPMLLHRTKLPKFTPPVGARPMSPTSRDELQKHYYHWKELCIGTSIQVYGRTMAIFDCDKFTRQWYKQQLHMDDRQLTPIKVEFEYNPQAPPPTIPPNTLGIGSEEDSLGNVFHLVPKPPPRDYNRYKEAQGVVLRYAVRMTEAPGHSALGPFDTERRFILSYYPVDGTLCIFEPPHRNSGIQGGMYLDRTKVRKPSAPTCTSTASPAHQTGFHPLGSMQSPLGAVTGRAAHSRPRSAPDAISALSSSYYTEGDLHIGAVLSIYKRAFKITEADGYTLQYLEKQHGACPWASYEQVCGKVKKHLQTLGKGSEEALRGALIQGDQYGSGQLTAAALQDALKQLKLDLNDHEVLTMIRRIGTNNCTLPAAMLVAELCLIKP